MSSNESTGAGGAEGRATSSLGPACWAFGWPAVGHLLRVAFSRLGPASAEMSHAALDRPGHRDLGFACTPACVMMRALPLSGSLHRFMYMYVQKLHESTLEIHANLDVDCPFSLKFCCLFVLPLITQIFPAASCSAGRVWGGGRSTRREDLQQNGARRQVNLLDSLRTNVCVDMAQSYLAHVLVYVIDSKPC
jgi:hypothetical protein